MYEIVGKYNKATVYARNTDRDAYAQVLRMCNTEVLQSSRICMMPDMHASAGCTVGTSMTITGCANPAWVGGDIGCGMQVYKLAEREIDCAALDAVIRNEIPSGAAIFPGENKAVRQLHLSDLICGEWTRKKIVDASLGTLGGGNHFIEVDRDTDGALYLVIRKQQGAESCMKYLKTLYQEVEKLDKSAGFWVIRASEPKNQEERCNEV